MDRIRLFLGEICNHERGDQGSLVPVEFEGEEVASDRKYLGNNEDRYIDLHLYKDSEGDFWLYEGHVSRWRGESSEFDLFKIDWEDLQPGGERDRLGARLDLWERPLTPAEYLEKKGE